MSDAPLITPPPEWWIKYAAQEAIIPPGVPLTAIIVQPFPHSQPGVQQVALHDRELDRLFGSDRGE